MGCSPFKIFKSRHTVESQQQHREDGLQQKKTDPPGHEIVSGKPEVALESSEGRRYHNNPDVAYVLPNDDQENDRIHLQHWLIKVAAGGNFSSPIGDELDKGIIVHDAGCGPGTWTLEMANDFPRSTFIGTDVSPRFPEAIKPANCQFQVHNLLGEDFSRENYFNFIYQRMLILGILEKDWEKMIQNHVRTLAPGGWLECIEIAIHRAHPAGPHHEILVNAWNAMCKHKGLFSEISDHLEEMFRRAGLVNIEVREIVAVMDQSTQYGRLAWEDYQEVFIALRPLIVKACPELAGDEKYSEFLKDCLKEYSDLGTRHIFFAIWGQKPSKAEDN